MESTSLSLSWLALPLMAVSVMAGWLAKELCQCASRWRVSHIQANLKSAHEVSNNMIQDFGQENDGIFNLKIQNKIKDISMELTKLRDKQFGSYFASFSSMSPATKHLLPLLALSSVPRSALVFVTQCTGAQSLLLATLAVAELHWQFTFGGLQH